MGIYPIAGSYARTNAFSREPTLDGDRWLVEAWPGDAAAIDWLRAHVEGAPTILEAFGPDFSEDGHGRISTYTGLPTVIGWAGHEVQWGHEPGARPDDVRALYSTPNLERARRLLTRYGVRYVVVGPLERLEYPAAGRAKFDQLGERVFGARGTVVYEIRSGANA
jgi:uncharacterized membrane protein